MAASRSLRSLSLSAFSASPASLRLSFAVPLFAGPVRSVAGRVLLRGAASPLRSPSKAFAQGVWGGLWVMYALKLQKTA